MGLFGLFRNQRGKIASRLGAAGLAVLFGIAAGLTTSWPSGTALAHEGEEEGGSEATPRAEENGSPFMFLGEGDVAPDFTLIDQNKETISLAGIRRKKWSIKND